MSGSVIQLNAIGGQDTDVHISPERTFFQTRHKRHTPFAQEPKEIQFNTTTAYGREATANIPRSADLLAKLYLVIDLAALTTTGRTGDAFVEDVGRAIIDSVQLEAGSVTYDTLWPELMHAYEDLSELSEQQLGKVTGNTGFQGNTSGPGLAARRLWAGTAQRLYIPLEFYFQKDYGHAIPLISLHLTDLKVRVRLKTRAQVLDDVSDPQTGTGGDITNMFLLGEFVYLDDAERDLFARTRHKYLITQNQRTVHSVALGATSTSIPIFFNHPTKEFILMQRTQAATDLNDWFDFTGGETGQYVDEAFSTMAITLNNNDRVRARDPLYFGVVQPKAHHTRIPEGKVYVYSLAIAPEMSPPTGSLNLSRIENTRIDLTFAALAGPVDWYVFARSINVVKVYAGVASIRWSS